MCQSSAEDAFGPSVEGCFGGFDFTLLFEESILTIAPLAIFLLVLPFRLMYLYKRKKVARGGLLYITKLVSISHSFLPHRHWDLPPLSCRFV